MVKQFSSFSPCGKNFVYCGPDGKLKIWDTFSGVLKQEFVPNLHLNQPCTSFVWLSLSKSSVSWKSKKRKSEKKSVKALGLGTNSGNIALYSLAEGKIIVTLQGGHSSTITCLSWSNEHGLFSVSDNIVVIWDLERKSVKSKWKCGKGKITSIAAGDEFCVTGSFNLRVWKIDNQELVKTLPGHSSDVTNLSFINSQYFISTSSSDRHISVWSLTDEKEDPIVRFGLTDYVQGLVNIKESEGRVNVAATCASGLLHFFSYQFNGKVNKSIKPALTVEIACSSQNGTANSSTAVGVLPVVAALVSSPESVVISYGLPPVFSFETININKDENRLCLVRTPKSKQEVNNSSKVGEEIGEEVEYVGGATSGVKRGREGEVEVPLQERLNNLSKDGEAMESEATPLSMAQLLSQGLESRDRGILETVLFRKDINTIKQTVTRLPVGLVPLLVKELINMLQGKTITSSMGLVWLRCLLSVHASQLLADRPTLEMLNSLHGLVETRLTAMPRLNRLSGRLDLLLQQVQSASHLETNQQAMLLFYDEESSDEGSSLAGDRHDPSESEDKWDELSDEELEIEDANMSS